MKADPVKTQKEALFEAVLENVTDAIIVIDKDPALGQGARSGWPSGPDQSIPERYFSQYYSFWQSVERIGGFQA